jgi:hypothetical protein
VLAPDGTVVLVYLAQLGLGPLVQRRVTAELFRPGSAPIRGDASASEVRGGEGFLRFGSATIEGELLRWETPGLSGELRYRPRAAPTHLGHPFLEHDGRSLTWNVEIPDADVEGELRFPGGALTIAGRGYRDRVWMDIPLWSFPLRELDWGRAVTGSHATTWVRARTTKGLVSAAWLDGALLPDRPEIALVGTRELLASRVVDLDGLKLGALRPLLRRITGDPHEIKWASRASLGGEEGVAIHEIVRWWGHPG